MPRRRHAVTVRAVRQVFPTDSGAADLDPVDLVHDDVRQTDGTRPWVLMNMIASADGATAVDGTSGGLGGDADRRLLGTLRGLVRASSVSRAEMSDVTLEFRWGIHVPFAVADVRERLDRVMLPSEAERPVILRYDPQPGADPAPGYDRRRRRSGAPAAGGGRGAAACAY